MLPEILEVALYITIVIQCHLAPPHCNSGLVEIRS